VVAITADVLPVLGRWGVPRDRIEVIENWAPLEALPVRPRRNEWGAAHGLDDKLVYLYSGSLASRHDPALLLALAHRLAERAEARLVAISEGPGAEWLAAARASLPADNLIVLPFQPFDRMKDALASSDVLLAALDAEAGQFSVPTKILAYLCASRPILAALPESNLAARTLQRSGAGIVVDPGDEHAFCEAAEWLAREPGLRARLGVAGRRYAEAHFPIGEIAARFEPVCARAVAGAKGD
jgi:glycosyltransferase involved in cell wall biosynthesis